MIPIKITIDWIRHGYSCANAYKEGPKQTTENTYLNTIKNAYNFLASTLIYDPVLTKTGIDQATKLGTYMRSNKSDFTYDIICCSNLRRAIETAAFANSIANPNTNIKQTLYVVPYVSEVKSPGANIGIDYENFPINTEESKKYINNVINKNNLNINVDWSIFDQEAIKSPKEVNLPNYDYFIENILPQLINKTKINKDQYKIGIVSHSHFISKLISKLKTDIKNTIQVANTSIWTETLNIKPVNKDTIIKYDVINRDTLKCNSNICVKYDGATNTNNDNNDNNIGRCYREHPNIYGPKNVALDHYGGKGTISDKDYKKLYKEYKMLYMTSL